MESKIIPNHIAFIMDGNGRWAKQRMLPRKVGHKYGVEALKKVVDYCSQIGVKVISVFAFSTENWARPQDEIDAIFDLLEKFSKTYLVEYVEKGYQIRFCGDLTQLPQKTLDIIKDVVSKAKSNKGMVVNIAINYGGRQEIVKACNAILQSGIKEITEEDFSNCIYNPDLPYPDVIVRSSGEKRLSNFFLWGAAYSELIFIDDYWPDFNSSTIDKIIEEYSKRDRRYGKVKRLD